MKSSTYILLFCLITIAFAAGLWYGHSKKPVNISQPLRLEEILSIKELHLVKHVYQDLFFLHKKNDHSKSIRAIVQVPVEITAYLNLKEIQVVYRHDSIKQVVLPRAHLNTPHYKIDQMVIRETHAIQIHVGKDLYKEVSEYLSEVLKNRMDTVRNLAAANRILVQAEAEGKAYIENLLKSAGRDDVTVVFSDDAISLQVFKFDINQQREILVSSNAEKQTRIEELSFGFTPLLTNQ